jgi:HAD superfamily hydrolase (TIGR01509 family)
MAEVSFWWDRAQRADAEPCPLDCVIFDVDGTLADTERDGHRPAFNAAFAAHGLDIAWSPEEYGRLLKITGGHRRIAADLRARGFGDAADRLAADVHATKTELFRNRIHSGGIKARPGLLDLVTGLRDAGIRIAVATTGQRAWVAPLVRYLLGEGVVEVTVTGDDVLQLKPDPEVYERALDELGVTPENALAVEDSAIGLQAALGAGLATVVVPTAYTATQDFGGAAAVLPAFDGPMPLLAERCRQLHERWWTGHHR